MDIGALFLLLALLTLVAMFLAQPFMERQAKIVSAEELEYSALLAKRDHYINALKELDFDYSLGKIPEEDYPTQRAELLTMGVESLRKLDAFETSGAKMVTAEDRLEAAIAARRADATEVSPVALDADDELESLIAARRSKRQAQSAGFCPNCGHPVLSNDKFCTSCGKATHL
ncbi:MAG: zinc-ribbon domain-containing protein [Anaerolineales bacterium]|nr:zinc-ribbon domain-containing protein [Anaerolineales bacterium]